MFGQSPHVWVMNYVNKLQSQQHEDIREWVLAISMDQQIEQTLPKDERGCFEGTLTPPDSGIRALPCVITG